MCTFQHLSIRSFDFLGLNLGFVNWKLSGAFKARPLIFEYEIKAVSFLYSEKSWYISYSSGIRGSNHKSNASDSRQRVEGNSRMLGSWRMPFLQTLFLEACHGHKPVAAGLIQVIPDASLGSPRSQRCPLRAGCGLWDALLLWGSSRARGEGQTFNHEGLCAAPGTF